MNNKFILNIFRIFFSLKIFIFLVLLIFIFINTWNLISFLHKYKFCNEVKIRFDQSEEFYRGTSVSSDLIKYGYYENRKVYINENSLNSDSIYTIWYSVKSINGYLKMDDETINEFKIRRIYKYLKPIIIVSIIFGFFHFLTLIIKKTNTNLFNSLSNE